MSWCAVNMGIVTARCSQHVGILTLVLAVVRVIQKQSTVKLGMRGNTPEKPGSTSPELQNILPCGFCGFIPSLC
jgi:hypothetical protein